MLGSSTVGKRYQTRVLPTHTPELFQAAVTEAAALLRRGELVALPTETVYGLAANALDAVAVERIYRVKGRPPQNPIIVHVADDAMARRCVHAWPETADRLARAFWPGPLTLVLPRSPQVPDAVTAGGPTVGVRWPSHPLIQAVIRACGFPLAAPSANLATRVSPTQAAHVVRALRDRIPLVVDGGPSQVGIESTVLDLSMSVPRVLRPGMIHRESLRSVLGDLGEGQVGDSATLRSPGQLAKHYAPAARLLVLRWRDDAELTAQLQNLDVQRRAVHVLAHTVIPSGPDLGGVSVIPHDAEAFARALYAELHRCDAAGAQTIVVEAVPETPPWAAVVDRLRRASTFSPAPRRFTGTERIAHEEP